MSMKMSMKTKLNIPAVTGNMNFLGIHQTIQKNSVGFIPWENVRKLDV
jgi:hypothetical protein